MVWPLSLSRLSRSQRGVQFCFFPGTRKQRNKHTSQHTYTHTQSETGRGNTAVYVKGKKKKQENSESYDAKYVGHDYSRNYNRRDVFEINRFKANTLWG